MNLKLLSLLFLATLFTPETSCIQVQPQEQSFEFIAQEIRISYTDQDRARIDRMNTGTYSQEDIARGFANLDVFMNDESEDEQLRRILINVFQHKYLIYQNVLTEAELKNIPLSTFHKAGVLVLDNTAGWCQQASIDALNMLIDRHFGRLPSYR